MSVSLLFFLLLSIWKLLWFRFSLCPFSNLPQKILKMFCLVVVHFLCKKIHSRSVGRPLLDVQPTIDAGWRTNWRTDWQWMFRWCLVCCFVFREMLMLLLRCFFTFIVVFVTAPALDIVGAVGCCCYITLKHCGAMMLVILTQFMVFN